MWKCLGVVSVRSVLMPAPCRSVQPVPEAGCPVHCGVGQARATLKAGSHHRAEVLLGKNREEIILKLTVLGFLTQISDQESEQSFTL